jgi:hypothetical protein
MSVHGGLHTVSTFHQLVCVLLLLLLLLPLPAAEASG